MLIEPNNAILSIERQCELLGLSKSSYYYQPFGESAENLVLMKEIDKLYIKFPFYGARRLLANLADEYQPINLKKVRRLMKLMRIERSAAAGNLSKTQFVKTQP